MNSTSKPKTLTGDLTSCAVAPSLDAQVVDWTAEKAPLSGWARLAYLSIAGGFFLIGLLGVLLPILPATPFFLLTSYFLIRSSPRLHSAMLNSRLVGPILQDWYHRGGIQQHIRIKAIIFVTITVGLTIFLTQAAFWPTVSILALATIGITVIACLPTAKPSE